MYLAIKSLHNTYIQIHYLHDVLKRILQYQTLSRVYTYVIAQLNEYFFYILLQDVT